MKLAGARPLRTSILSLQSISWDVADNVNQPGRLDPTMELITYSFVLYLQHGRHDVKCKPSISTKTSCKTNENALLTIAYETIKPLRRRVSLSTS